MEPTPVYPSIAIFVAIDGVLEKPKSLMYDHEIQLQTHRMGELAFSIMAPSGDLEELDQSKDIIAVLGERCDPKAVRRFASMITRISHVARVSIFFVHNPLDDGGGIDRLRQAFSTTGFSKYIDGTLEEAPTVRDRVSQWLSLNQQSVDAYVLIDACFHDEEVDEEEVLQLQTQFGDAFVQANPKKLLSSSLVDRCLSVLEQQCRHQGMAIKLATRWWERL